MQSTLPPSLSAGHIALWIIAMLFANGVITYVVTWLLNRRKYKAEVVQVSAGSVKIEAEARQIDATTVMELVERVRELVEINSQLQDELNETGRERDNFEYDLKIREHDLAQEKTRSELREHFIEQLEAANKFGVRLRDLPQLKDLPPEIKRLLIREDDESERVKLVK